MYNKNSLDNCINKIDINCCPECLGIWLMELDFHQFSIYRNRCTSCDKESTASMKRSKNLELIISKI